MPHGDRLNELSDVYLSLSDLLSDDISITQLGNSANNFKVEIFNSGCKNAGKERPGPRLLINVHTPRPNIADTGEKSETALAEPPNAIQVSQNPLQASVMCATPAASRMLHPCI